MNKKLLIGGLILGGLAGAVIVRQRSRSRYEEDEIDAAGQGDTFGERDGNAPEQRWAPAETKAVTPEELSMASRVETAWDGISSAWPTLTLDDIRPAEGDLDKLAGLIADKTGQQRNEVRTKLDGILAQEVPDSSYPAH